MKERDAVGADSMATKGKRSSSKEKSRYLRGVEEVKAKRKNALRWLFEPLEDDPGYSARRLFGFDAAYLDDCIYVAVRDGEPPWEGMLVCTSRERHAALLADFPQLAPHPILGKWLHLSSSHPHFESAAQSIIQLSLDRDFRLGVAPRPRRGKAR